MLSYHVWMPHINLLYKRAIARLYARNQKAAETASETKQSGQCIAPLPKGDHPSQDAIIYRSICLLLLAYYYPDCHLRNHQRSLPIACGSSSSCHSPSASQRNSCEQSAQASRRPSQVACRCGGWFLLTSWNIIGRKQVGATWSKKFGHLLKRDETSTFLRGLCHLPGISKPCMVLLVTFHWRWYCTPPSALQLAKTSKTIFTQQYMAEPWRFRWTDSCPEISWYYIYIYI